MVSMKVLFQRSPLDSSKPIRAEGSGKHTHTKFEELINRCYLEGRKVNEHSLSEATFERLVENIGHLVLKILSGHYQNNLPFSV